MGGGGGKLCFGIKKRVGIKFDLSQLSMALKPGWSFYFDGATFETKSLRLD